jgi:hypothetical protein
MIHTRKGQARPSSPRHFPPHFPVVVVGAQDLSAQILWFASRNFFRPKGAVFDLQPSSVLLITTVTLLSSEYNRMNFFAGYSPRYLALQPCRTASSWVANSTMSGRPETSVPAHRTSPSRYVVLRAYVETALSLFDRLKLYGCGGAGASCARSEPGND